MESCTELHIRKTIPEDLYISCFHPIRHVKKKFHGQWKEMQEKLLPGYVFLKSERISELYPEIMGLPMLTKLLGRDRKHFAALPENEALWLDRIMSGGDTGNGVVSISQINVNENDEITILSGPLKNMEGLIKKIHLHKRIAEIEVDFMNRKTVIHLGIEILGKR